MPDLETRQVWLIAVSVPLLTGLALWFYAVAPLGQTWLEGRSQLALVEQAVAGGPSLGPRIIGLERDVAALHAELYGHMDEQPPEQLQAELMGQLQALSWQTGVQLGGILPREGEQLNVFQSYRFDIDMQADYAQLVAWVERLPEHIGFAVVDRFTMQAEAVDPDDPTRPPNVRMQVTVNSWRPLAGSGEQAP